MRLLLAVYALLLPHAAPAFAQTATETLPELEQRSAARVAAERFLSALNGAGPTEAFVASSFAKASLSREPAGARAKPLDELKARAGGFQVLEWRPQGERMVDVLVRSKRGNRHAKIVLFTSSKEPGKISDVFILPDRDPARAEADAFPAHAVNDDQLAQLVTRRLDALTHEGSFRGALLVARGDRVLLREARGMADEVWQISNRTDTRFNLASVSKMWTAAVLLKLAEEGRLSLDDTLAKWVPSYPHREAAAKITLRQLLHHRGGIGEWDGRQVKEPLTASQAAATMTSPPGEPDKQFGYSNAGYVLLGAAAEKVSGLTYQQLVEKLVFKPAGMKSSGFWPVSAVIPNRATGYLRPAADPLGFGPKYANDQYLGYGGDPSGGAYSSLDDLFAFHRALAAGRLLKPHTLKLMIDTSVEFPGGPRPAHYGLGLRLEPCAGVPTLGHSGGGANSGISSATYASLDGQWTVIVLGNTDPMPEQVAIDVCELVHRS